MSQKISNMTLEEGVFDIEQHEIDKNCRFLFRSLPCDMIRLLYQFVNYDPAICKSKNLDWNLKFRKICKECSDAISVEDCKMELQLMDFVLLKI